MEVLATSRTLCCGVQLVVVVSGFLFCYKTRIVSEQYGFGVDVRTRNSAVFVYMTHNIISQYSINSDAYCTDFYLKIYYFTALSCYNNAIIIIFLVELIIIIIIIIINSNMHS